MIRKEGGRRPLLVQGSHRQMLQGIKENLRHAVDSKNQTADLKPGMQIKADLAQSTPNLLEKANNGCSGKNDRVHYTQKALDQIRQSLEGFQIPDSSGVSGPSGANHLSQLNGLDVESTPVNKHMLQQLTLMGCDEELASRALKICGNKSVDDAVQIIQTYSNHENKNGFNKMATSISGFGGTKVIRKPSFEEKYRQGSPVNSESSSIRSESPGVKNLPNGRQTPPPPPLPPKGVRPSPSSRGQMPLPLPGHYDHKTGQLPSNWVSLPVHMPPHGALLPGKLPLPGVPVSLHGTGHLPGQLPPHGGQYACHVSPPPQREGFWPAAQNGQPTAQKGISPTQGSRPAMVMQHSPTGMQAQMQLQQNPQPVQVRDKPPPPPPSSFPNPSSTQNCLMSVTYGHPPPVPPSSNLPLAQNNLMSVSCSQPQPLPPSSNPLTQNSAMSVSYSQPPPVPASSNSSSTQSSPLSLTYSHPPPPYFPKATPSQQTPSEQSTIVQSHIATNNKSPLSSNSSSPAPAVLSPDGQLKPAAMQAWSAKQPPIIMQQVSSRQVQKPVLQTATAPLSPPVGGGETDLQYNYVSSVQAQVNMPSPAQSPNTYQQAYDYYAEQNLAPGPGADYYTNQEGMGYQQAIQRFLCDTQSNSPPPRNQSPMSVISTISTPSTNSDILDKPPPPYPGKFPVMKLEDLRDIQEEFLLDEDSHSEHSGHSSAMSEEPASGQLSALGAAKKFMRSKTQQNYSPQAYKFFMEQHIENIFKHYHERTNRREQLEIEMQKVGLSSEAQNQMRKMLNQKESNYIRLKRAKMNKNMFEKSKTLGVGAFGEVALVRKVDTGQLFAMKTLRKREVLQRNQEAHVKAERDILAEADNEWVVKLYYSFQDKENLYFVMDYIPGGDLMSLLIKFGIFQEPLAQFYVAELVLAIESVHNMGFIHRDIKPDNILIDRDGHIKLTDFGLCTGFRWTHNSKYYQKNNHSRQDSMEVDENWGEQHCHCMDKEILKPLERRKLRHQRRCLAHSLVGTPNYIAPEVLLREGYNMSCDWWSVGVILYEMLVGQPPFLANSPAETQHKVINWRQTLHIPPEAKLSDAAMDLTYKLCRGPEDRLGRNGAQDIKNHLFFQNIPWESLRRNKAPHIPKIRSATDTSNFDPVDPGKLRSSTEHLDKNMTGGQAGTINGKTPPHAFFEFTFRRFFDEGSGQWITKPTQEYSDIDDSSEQLSNISSKEDYYEGDTSSEHSVNTKDSNGPVYV